MAILGIFAGLYIGFLCVSVMFLDHITPFDRRILSPVFVAALVIVLHGMHRSVRWGVSLARYALAVFVGGLALRSLAGGLLFIHSSYLAGLGFNSKAWHESEVLQAIAHLSPDVVVYSNRPHAVYLHTGRLVSDLSQLQQGRRPNPDLDPDCETHMVRFLSRTRAETSVLACFHDRRRPSTAAEDHRRFGRPPLRVLMSGADGILYGVE